MRREEGELWAPLPRFLCHSASLRVKADLAVLTGENPCFDSSGMQSARCCPFPVICTGAGLLGLVTAGFVSPTGRKRGGFCPAARRGRGAGCARGRARGSVARRAAVVFPLPLCNGTAGFSVNGGQRAAPSRLQRSEGAGGENGKAFAVFALLTLFQLHGKSGWASLKQRGKPVALRKAYAPLEERWAQLRSRMLCLFF